MKFEVIPNKKKRVGVTLGIISVIAVIGITAFTITRASYKQTQSVPLIKGNISYNKSDLEIVAIKLKDGSTYTDSDIVPTSGYILNTEETICKDKSGNKIETTFEYNNDIVNIGVTKKGTKCTLVFESGTKLKDLILSKNTIDASRSTGPFTSAYITNTAGKIFSSTDDDGTTYFFAGSGPNNWLTFAGFYWRIIRINGDGSVRIIYNGSDTSQTGESTQIGKSAFNTLSNDNAYVGYMYGTPGSNTYDETHANINSSTIKTYIDNWYSKNLKDYERYIDTTAGFCGDRTINNTDKSWSSEDTKLGYGANITYYAPYYRFYNIHTPTYSCTNENDLYTLTTSNKGNKTLANPIGLITVDETLYAGAYGVQSPNYWLKTKVNYWTMSPMSFGRASFVINDISIGNPAAYSMTHVSSNAVRPVINIKGDSIALGSGTESDPYKIS